MDKMRVTFPSGKLLLEGILAIPEGVGPFPAVIICHPHPLYGGSMDNNVVNCLAETLTRASLASFKFNFRGVGRSQGAFGQGIGEQEDVKAAVSFASTIKEIDCQRIGLVGYSAGAAFAFPVVYNDIRIRPLAAVSPPLSMFDFDFFKGCLKPKLLLLGSRDDLTPTNQFLEFCRSLAEPKEYEIIRGADHFWRGYEARLADRVTDFFTKRL
ncbi:MAG: alpha/beta hydrolase [Dehalococcoidia bacterium]